MGLTQSMYTILIVESNVFRFYSSAQLSYLLSFTRWPPDVSSAARVTVKTHSHERVKANFILTLRCCRSKPCRPGIHDVVQRQSFRVLRPSGI